MTFFLRLGGPASVLPFVPFLFLPAVAAVAFGAYHETTLPNGIRVILIEHRANPMIASSVLVGAGVVHETTGLNGASHLLEHLLFNGTTTRTQRELYDAVDRVGAYNNATTREDHTLFTLLIQREFIETGLDLQADMLFRSTLPAGNFDKEKEIVLEEMARDASDPAQVAAERFRAFAYQGTPLARPVLGTRESIAAIPREDVLAYYRARYVPDNMLLVLMGDFETESMLAIVRRTVGAPSPTARPLPSASTTWPLPPIENLALHPLDAPRFHLHAGFPLGLEARDPLVPAVELLLEALSDGDDSPLQQALTGGSNAPAFTAAAGLSLRTGPWSTVDFSATLPRDKPFAPVLDALARGLHNLGPGSEAWSRIDRVRTRARAREILAADQIHYYAMTHADALLEAPAGWLNGAARRFDGVTGDQLDRAARLLAGGLAGIRISVSGPGLSRGASRWEPPETPKSTAADRRIRVDQSLTNGSRVLVEQNSDSQVFAVHALLHPRAASEPAGKEGIASFLHRLMARGSAGANAAALAARLARLGATLKTDDDPRVPFDDYYTTPEFSFIRLEVPADAWRESIGLLGELLREPRVAPDDIEAVRKEMLDLQARRDASSRNRAVDAAERLLAPFHPLARPVLGTPSSIAGITADDLRAFHQHYVTGRRLIVSVVSPVAPEPLLDALQATIGLLPTGEGLSEIPPAAITSSETPPDRTAELKEQTTIVLTSLFDAPEADRPALLLAGALLSDQLEFELRERRGLAYSVGASIAPWAGRMRLLVTMGTRRENVDEAIDGIRGGLATFSPGGGEATRRAAAALRGRMLMRRLTRINQAFYLGLSALPDRPPAADLETLTALMDLDPARVAEVARRHLDIHRCILVVR